MSERERYYKVGPAFWTDNRHWRDDDRLCALYILTSPHRNTEGLFRLPVAYVAADLGWQDRRVRRALDQLVADDFIGYDYEAGVVLIVKALKWQQPLNPNGVKAAVKALDAVPPTVLASRFRELAERFAERLWEGLPPGLPHPPSSTLLPLVGGAEVPATPGVGARRGKGSATSTNEEEKAA